VDAGAYGGATGVLDTRFVGHLDETSGDSLWIRVGSTDGPLVSIHRANIHELEISDGRKRNPGKGALWGAGVGLGLGILTAAAVDDCTMGYRGFWFDVCDWGEGAIVVGSITAGAALGALVGLLIKSERWVAVPPGSLTFRQDGGGFSLGLEVQVGF
jgi:hypothetical protein